MFPAFLRCPDGFNVILKYDLVRLLLKSLEAKPPSVTDGPVFLVGAVNTTMTKVTGMLWVMGLLLFTSGPAQNRYRSKMHKSIFLNLT
ncbi:hypothetical protein SXCC_00278 [Gluconacetobacter sp. SXCC-1]|nr:hypothetical protein SXCC_00278 [Gluconacetobacter sp. SXCC-1]